MTEHSRTLQDKTQQHIARQNSHVKGNAAYLPAIQLRNIERRSDAGSSQHTTQYNTEQYRTRQNKT
jgi:hypothetical protein